MCSVFGCKNRSKLTREMNIKYFSFPKDKLFCKKWIAACKRKDKINVKNARICSVHFTEDDYAVPLRQRLLNYTPKNCRNLRNDAIPTQNLPGNKVVQQKNNAREKRLIHRNLLKKINNTEKRSKQVSNTSEILPEITTVFISENFDENQSLKERIEKLEEENLLLKNENSRLLGELKKQTSDRLERVFCLFTTPQQTDNERILGTFFSPVQIKRIINP